MADARETLEALGHKVSEVDGRFYVRDPRGFEQGPWDQSQLDGWAHAVAPEDDVSRETSTLNVVTEQTERPKRGRKARSE